jgi:HEAT repeat protein
MDDSIRARLNDVRSDDKDAQNSAYSALMETTEVAVDWAYEAWDELVAMLRHESNRVRAIASQVLCNLSRSDPDRRILRDLPALLQVTRDERFVTARHCLQSLWKVGAAGPEQRRAVVEGLAGRFRECGDEKNCTLIRFDIVQALRNIHDAAPDDASVRRTAHELMELETDPRYRKKYAGVWKGVPAA